jgi:hypothetical protein
MGLFSIPDPVSMFESAKDAQLGRQEVGVFVSASYSFLISSLWRAGAGRLLVWLGLGKALQDGATAMYLALQQEMKPGFLVLTVPKDMLTAANVCDVCRLLDGDFRLKMCFYCKVCGKWICEADAGDWIRRVKAAQAAIREHFVEA